MLIVARHGSEKNFLAKQALQLNFPLASHLHHPLTRKPLREKTATCGGRKQGIKRALQMKFFFDIRVLIQ